MMVVQSVPHAGVGEVGLLPPRRWPQASNQGTGEGEMAFLEAIIISYIQKKQKPENKRLDYADVW